MKGGLQIGYITYVDMGNLNASFSGTNVVVIKKIKTPIGDQYPYVSGQMLRYIYREKLDEMGWELSPLQPTGESQGNPEKYIDDDIFGFMTTARKGKAIKRGEASTRTSPIKVSAMIGVYPLMGNKDLLVRYPIDRKTKEKIGEPSLVEQEFSGMNYFKGCTLIDLDSIGCGKGFEKYIPENEKRRRVIAFIDAFRLMFGGAKQARMLSDITPKFVVGIAQKYKAPVLLDALKVDEERNIILSPLLTVLDQYKDIIEKLTVGIRTGVFSNEEKVEETFKQRDIEVLDSNEVLERMKEWA